MRSTAALLCLGVVACGDPTEQPDATPDASVVDATAIDASPLDLGRLTPSCFVGGEQPQLDLTGPVANWTWNDPHVLRTADGFVMYASATDAFQFPVRSYRLTSTDGVAWSVPSTQPVLADAAPGSWDAGGIETPAVVHFAGRYHLFYTGYAHVIGTPEHSVQEFRLGHAVSDDGVTFTRVSDLPLLGPSGTTDDDPSNDWYAFVVGEPAPLVVDGRLQLGFTALGAAPSLGSLQVLGAIASDDGVTWSPPVQVLAPDQTIYPRGDGWVGYSTPSAIAIEGTLHLFFDVARQPEGGDWRQLRLHHASSPDGAIWTQDRDAIRAAGDLAWTADEIRSPAALLDGTTLRLYFAGHELDGTAPDHFGIGMLTCDLARR